MFDLTHADKELEYLNLSARDIVDALELEDVEKFLLSLGVEQLQVMPEKGYIISPTICHNPLGAESSMKLYWYQNNKIFRCYTECNEAMSIFTLYQKFMALNYHEVSFVEAVDYVKKFIHGEVKPRARSNTNYDIEKYKYNTVIPELEEYNHSILDYFTVYHHPAWIKDGILPETMDKFNIRFSLGQNKIIIPHYDIKNRLIGIRGRALEKKEIDEFGKYRPIQVGETIYTHPLQFNLYGINFHQNGINKRRSALLVEGEKSVMIEDGWYGDLSNSVAVCGSHFNKYQIALLISNLNVNEIIVAFDKEYEQSDSDQGHRYRAKIESMCKPFLNQANFYYIWDYNNLLEEKDAPVDKGQRVFEELYRNKVKVR